MTETTVKEVSKFGNGAHVTVPKSWIGDELKITHIPKGYPKLFEEIIKSEDNPVFDLTHGHKNASSRMTKKGLVLLDASITDIEGLKYTALLVFESEGDSNEFVALKKQKDSNGWESHTKVLRVRAEDGDLEDCSIDPAYAWYKLSKKQDVVQDLVDKVSRNLVDLKTQSRRLENKAEALEGEANDTEELKKAAEEQEKTEVVQEATEEVKDKLNEAEVLRKESGKLRDTEQDLKQKRDELKQKLEETESTIEMVSSNTDLSESDFREAISVFDSIDLEDFQTEDLGVVDTIEKREVINS